MLGYKLAMVFYSVVAILCFSGSVMVFFASWLWYWKALAWWILIPTGWGAVKLAYHAWELDKIFRQST